MPLNYSVLMNLREALLLIVTFSGGVYLEFSIFMYEFSVVVSTVNNVLRAGAPAMRKGPSPSEVGCNKMRRVVSIATECKD
jgi:hypothetical protein